MPPRIGAIGTCFVSLVVMSIGPRSWVSVLVKLKPLVTRETAPRMIRMMPKIAAGYIGFAFRVFRTWILS
jgi:hypothetical protein